MKGKTGWLLYDEGDFQQNRAFADLMVLEAQKQGFALETVLTSALYPMMDSDGPGCLLGGEKALPDFVISRQRDSFLSAHLEQMGVPVYNNAKVCGLCNDKRKTHVFLKGLPMLDSVFLSGQHGAPPPGTAFPVILKPACSHGGDRVFWAKDAQEWLAAAGKILPEPMIQQEIASDAGCDLRVYVIFGRIAAAVMRRARQGFISNFKQGGSVALHTLTEREKALAQAVIDRFAQSRAPLCFAGIDFLYHHGEPVVSEVEDVVGSRMLYQVSDINIAACYWEALARELCTKK